ncbi:MAG TPA: TPM domain-containing protein [Saprospiraceae bacterium]|nr:TPM domain-containing protein [Saprospiraceae bacterium]
MFAKKHHFFSHQEEEQIILAIRHAERRTSGEIRVHVQHFIDHNDVLAEAIKTFYRLGMDKTEHRNGVIFFIVPEKKMFAVYGDEGIHEKVSDGFWNDVKDILAQNFKKGLFVDGLVKGIELTGEKLLAFFPYNSNDKNELPDEISYD